MFMAKYYTIPIQKEMVAAKSTLPISTRNATIICRKLNHMKFENAKKLLEGLSKEKVDLDGRYYTKTSGELLLLLNSAESNARAQGKEPEKMTLMISAHKGRTMLRGRRRRNFGLRMKLTNVHAILKP